MSLKPTWHGVDHSAGATSLFQMFLLFGLCSSVFMHPLIQTITDRNYERIVQKRANKSIIVMMFHGDHCPACQATYPSFISAAEKMKGIATFAHIDCSTNRFVPAQYGIRTIPSFYIAHPYGIDSYFSILRFESSFTKAAMKYIPDTVQTANTTWQPQRAAVLFTDKWSMPPLWKAVAWNLSDTGVTFAWTNKKATKTHFGVTGDSVVLFNGKKRFVYDGPVQFAEMREAIAKWFTEEAVSDDL